MTDQKDMNPSVSVFKFVGIFFCLWILIMALTALVEQLLLGTILFNGMEQLISFLFAFLNAVVLSVQDSDENIAILSSVNKRHLGMKNSFLLGSHIDTESED